MKVAKKPNILDKPSTNKSTKSSPNNLTTPVAKPQFIQPQQSIPVSKNYIIYMKTKSTNTFFFHKKDLLINEQL
jgi:hypothetical protein